MLAFPAAFVLPPGGGQAEQVSIHWVFAELPLQKYRTYALAFPLLGHVWSNTTHHQLLLLIHWQPALLQYCCNWFLEQNLGLRLFYCDMLPTL